MADGTASAPRRYRAFISYSRANKAFARRLQHRLETYRLPRRLRGVRAGGVRRLGMMFRDEVGFAAAPNLSAAIRAALSDSEYLIVVCSPESRASAWVAEEIAFFHGLRGQGRTLAVLIDGKAPAALHPALLLPDAAGMIHEPLAADFQDGGDGPRLALLKLVAALAELRLDELVERDAQRRLRTAVIAGGAAVLGLVLVSTLGAMTMNARLATQSERLKAQSARLAEQNARIVAQKAQIAAQEERSRSETMLSQLLNDMRKQLLASGDLKTLELLDQVMANYFAGQPINSMEAAQLKQLATLLQARGQDDEKRDDFAKAQAEFGQARQITKALLAARPNDATSIDDHALSEYYVAFINWRLENYGEAEARFDDYAGLAHRLVQIDPGNPKWLMEFGDAESNLGTFYVRRSEDLVRAEPMFRKTLSSYQAAEQQRPGDADILLTIADCYSWLADIQRLRGDYDGAEALRAQLGGIISTLSARNPMDAQVREVMNWNQLGLARIDIGRGAFDRASAALAAGHADAVALAREQPDDRGRAREVRIFELFQARTWMMMPAASRPADRTIDAALGDCGHDAMLPHNTEIVAFCLILRARHLALRGDAAGARTALAEAERRSSGRGDRLTERFGLDLRDELNQSVSPSNLGKYE